MPGPLALPQVTWRFGPAPNRTATCGNRRPGQDLACGVSHRSASGPFGTMPAGLIFSWVR